MSHNDQPTFPLEFYSHCLTAINAIKFSKREIDILACILSGRSAKGIAQFLSIAPKTAEAHTYNILRKLDCTSREGIISLIERSDKFLTLKKYYLSLLTQVAFEKALKNISHLTMGQKNDCFIVCKQTQEKINPLLQKIKSDLELAGINVSVEVKEKMGTFEFISSNFEGGISTIYILPETWGAGTETESFQKRILAFDKMPSNAFFLSFEKENEISKYLYINKIIYFEDNTKYYFSFFEALKKFLPHANLHNIIEEFNQQCKFTNESAEIKSPQEVSPTAEKGFYLPIRARFSAKKAAYFVYAFFAAVSTLVTWFFLLKGEINPSYITATQSEYPIRSDLILPTSSTLLNRPDLIAQIDEKFKKQDNGIQTVALVGIGGAGKTTLAREYVRLQKETVIWEMNAETNTSLMESFEALAHALARTEEDRGILRELNDIKKPSERERKIIGFVKDHLKIHPNWFLIYDNVEKFADIQKYYPLNAETWGQGRVILTTRDSTIQNNKQIDHVIFVGELDNVQKLNLFTQIMSNGENNKITAAQVNKTISFLENIPPFPLDVSVAAYYLKTTNVPYADYLAHLNQFDRDFTVIQEDLLKGAGEYTKTRHGIITLSLEQIMNIHKDFTDLLLFISLLDSQHIPRELLTRYKSDTIVDNFIYHLKKYSLADDASFITHRSRIFHA